MPVKNNSNFGAARPAPCFGKGTNEILWRGRSMTQSQKDDFFAQAVELAKEEIKARARLGYASEIQDILEDCIDSILNCYFGKSE